MIFLYTRPIPDAVADRSVRPSLRDQLIAECQAYTSLEWVEFIAQTVNLARTFTFDEILYEEPTTGHFRMKETFRIYIENVDHWTSAHKLPELIPQLKGEIQLR